MTSSFNILDSDDQMRLLKQVMEAGGLDAKRWTPQAMMGLIQRWKDRGLPPGKIPSQSEDSDFANGRAREIYAAYQATAAIGERRRFRRSAAPCHRNPAWPRADVLAQYHRSFRYILVDEYQDTNVVQYLWLRLLAQGHQATSAASATTTSRSIRGGGPRWRTSFASRSISRVPASSGWRANYRSTAPILAAAAGIDRQQFEGRLGKTLRPGDRDDGRVRMSVVGGLTLGFSDEEARMVGERAEALHREGHKLAEMADAGADRRSDPCLRGTADHAGSFPTRIVGGLRFYERAEIRDAIAYMRILVSQPADDLAFERIVNVPRRGVGEQGAAFHARGARAR